MKRAKIFCIALIASISSLCLSSAQAQNVEGIRALVNDEPITTVDVRNRMRLIIASTGMAQIDQETLAELYEAGILSHPVEVEIDLEPTVREGLGVLHGNCSHCHNSARDTQAQATVCYAPATDDEDEPLDFSLPADLGAVEDAPVLLTGRWLLGRPGDSEVLDRMSSRNQSERNPSMPPLGTEIVDEEGVAAVEAFIMALSESGL